MLRNISKQLPRLYRIAVLLAIVWLVHAQHERTWAARKPALTLDQAAQFFPGATRLAPPVPPYRQQLVSKADGTTIGMVLHTAPDSDRFRGYAGASDALLALDPTGRVIGASLLSSEDTRDHVEAIIENERFWRSFRGLVLGAPGHPEIDVVSGSTLTSDAIIQSVVDRLGGVAESSLFPTEILLAEVRLLLPAAASMEPHPTWTGVRIVYDDSGNKIAHALRTAPSQDTLLGYQGPSDVLVLLDREGERVMGLRLRKTFDNEQYTGRVASDEAYLRLYDGQTVRAVAEVDYESRGIEGVSGATLTSWVIAESVKRRLQAFLADRERPPPPPFFGLRDYLLMAMTIGALVMAFTPLRGKSWLRVAWQIITVAVLGFVTGDLISQALLAGWAQHGLPWRESIGLVLLAGAAFVVPWTTGKQLYCHHLCPHGALQQWMQRLPVSTLKVSGKLHRLLSAVPVVLLALVLASVLLGLGLNLAAVEAFDAYLFRVAGWSSIAIAVAGLFASAFIPLAYCKYGCPTGLLLKFLRWRSAGERFAWRDAMAGTFLLAAATVYYLT